MSYADFTTTQGKIHKCVHESNTGDGIVAQCNEPNAATNLGNKKLSDIVAQYQLVSDKPNSSAYTYAVDDMKQLYTELMSDVRLNAPATDPYNARLAQQLSNDIEKVNSDTSIQALTRNEYMNTITASVFITTLLASIVVFAMTKK